MWVSSVYCLLGREAVDFSGSQTHLGWCERGLLMDLQEWLLVREEMETVTDSRASEILMLWFKNVGAFIL